MENILPLAWITSNPGEITSWDGKWSWQSAPHAELPSFYLSDFFLREGRPWLHAEKVQHLKLPKTSHAAPYTDHFEWVGERSYFDKSFDTLLEHIQTGKLTKGVPYTFWQANKNFGHALSSHLYRQLKGIPSDHYSFGHTIPGQELVGATPEVLFLIDDGTVSTMALAGTSIDGKFTPKDEHEHQLVVDDIYNRLALLGPVTIGERGIKRSGILHHLMTPLEVELKRTADFIQLVQLLHPTPALGVFPRGEFGMNWLSDVDQLCPRQHYGAPVGVWIPKENRGICVVGIRSLQWSRDIVKIFAGCGVVAQSDRELEWQEINHKFNSILKLWGLK